MVNPVSTNPPSNLAAYGRKTAATAPAAEETVAPPSTAGSNDGPKTGATSDPDAGLTGGVEGTEAVGSADATDESDPLSIAMDMLKETIKRLKKQLQELQQQLDKLQDNDDPVVQEQKMMLLDHMNSISSQLMSAYGKLVELIKKYGVGDLGALIDILN